MEYTDDPIDRMSAMINDQVSAMPEKVMEMILDNVGPDTHVGASLRTDGSAALRAKLSSLDFNNLASYAERIINTSQALETNGLKHTAHPEHLLTIMDGAAAVAYNSSDDEDERVKTFYSTLAQAVPILPGIDSTGEPMAMEKLYYKDGAQNDLGKFDVLAQAREELSGDFIDPETKSYWEKTVRDMVPELRELSEIRPEDIPLSAGEDAAISEAEAYNATLAKSAGQLYQTLTGSNVLGPKEDATVLTGSLDEPVEADGADYADGAEVLT